MLQFIPQLEANAGPMAHGVYSRMWGFYTKKGNFSNYLLSSEIKEIIKEGAKLHVVQYLILKL